MLAVVVELACCLGCGVWMCVLFSVGWASCVFAMLYTYLYTSHPGSWFNDETEPENRIEHFAGCGYYANEFHFLSSLSLSLSLTLSLAFFFFIISCVCLFPFVFSVRVFCSSVVPFSAFRYS